MITIRDLGNGNIWAVRSSDGTKAYMVAKIPSEKENEDHRWVCSCPAKMMCWHIRECQGADKAS